MTIQFPPAANAPASAIARIRAAAPQVQDKVASKATASAAKAGGSVELSRQAQQLQQISAQLRTQDGVDHGRVERLRAALENGSYRIDSEQTARNLLAFERDL